MVLGVRASRINGLSLGLSEFKGQGLPEFKKGYVGGYQVVW